MPELPEVECMARSAAGLIKGRRIIRAWCDKALIRTPRNLEKELRGALIENVGRRGKYLLFTLSFSGKRYLMTIHPRMTGHLLFGKWSFSRGVWKSEILGSLGEKVNGYIRFLLILDNGLMMALSDVRRFAVVSLGGEEEIKTKLSRLGPDALSAKIGEFSR